MVKTGGKGNRRRRGSGREEDGERGRDGGWQEETGKYKAREGGRGEDGRKEMNMEEG